MPLVAHRRTEMCLDCGTCTQIIACPGNEGCIGCGACALACPNEAIEMVEEPREKQVTIEVNGMAASVPERISVREALALLGYPTATYPSDQGVFSPCRVGGCWSCALDIDGQVRLACLTPVRGGMHIATRLPQDFVPRRIVHGFMGHTVGGVGTPWHLKTGTRYIEVACFAAGCNFRCPQCQNWTTTYRGEGDALTPRQAAGIMTQTRIKFGVDRMAISGGECTLNRPWLVAYIRELSALNPDREARLHVDTNGSLFTRDYIDELVAAGMTDIGIDLKALRVGTFMRITGLKDAELARKYMETAWQAAGYCLERYDGQIFTGIGVPYNRALISLEEVGAIGIRIRDQISPSVQVCVLDYRGEFRSNISRPSYEEMNEVHKLLSGVGLKTVICQTPYGHIRP